MSEGPVTGEYDNFKKKDEKCISKFEPERYTICVQDETMVMDDSRARKGVYTQKGVQAVYTYSGDRSKTMEAMHRPFWSSKFSVNSHSKLGLCITSHKYRFCTMLTSDCLLILGVEKASKNLYLSPISRRLKVRIY